MTLKDLEATWPFVPWTEPIVIHITEGTDLMRKFACRVCIANNGFAASHGKLYESKVAFAIHMQDHGNKKRQYCPTQNIGKIFGMLTLPQYSECKLEGSILFPNYCIVDRDGNCHRHIEPSKEKV